MLLAGSHVAINLHYCGGELASVEFFAKKKDRCNKCGMKKSKSCCKDVTKLFSTKDFNSATLNFDFEQKLVLLPAINFVLSFDKSAKFAITKNSIWGNSPSQFQQKPFFILNKSLRV